MTITAKQVKDWYKQQFERAAKDADSPYRPDYYVPRSVLYSWIRSQIELGHEIEGLRVLGGRLPPAPDLWKWEMDIGLIWLADRMVKAEERRIKRERKEAERSVFEK